MMWVVWAETRKLLRAPSIRITMAIGLLVIVWAYITTHRIVTQGFWDPSLMNPQDSLSYASSVLAAMGTLLAVFVGAVSAGLEFGYRTWPALLTHGARRWEVWGVKLFSVAAVVAVWIVAALVVGYLSSIWASGKLALPRLGGTVLAQIVVLFSLLLFWAVFSFTFALAFRGTAAGVVVGIVFQVANMMLEGPGPIKVWLPIWNQKAVIAAVWGTGQRGIASFVYDPTYPPLCQAITVVTIMFMLLVVASYYLTESLRTD